MNRYKLSALLLLFVWCNTASAQLSVTPGQTAATLANALSGGGVTISNAVLNCPSVANGTYSYAGVSPILAISNGILLTSGHAVDAIGAEPPLVSSVNGTSGDPDMLPYLPAGAVTYDACILEFDVVPTGDTVSFNYQFGSEEYRQAVCTNFNDFFAFFISGPGITGMQNMALVPGTTIPVEVNSVNNGVVGTAPGAALVNCTSLGAGSPFTSYYIDNAGGTELSYKGYTTKLRAFHQVTPCATYHLKLSIVDAGNATHDSGVFLEANSLSSNGYHFSVADSIGNTINGIAHTIVKGCNPATVTIVANHTDPNPSTVSLTYTGSAVQGIDINSLPTSVVIPGGSTTASFTVQTLPALNGNKTLTISIPAICGNFDQVTLTILDTPGVRILTPDTAVCLGQSFRIRTAGSPGLGYTWTPTAAVDTASLPQPVASPMGTTTFTLSAAYPNAGCPPMIRTFTATLGQLNLLIMGPDSAFCTGTYYTFTGLGGGNIPLYWSFVPGDTIKNLDTLLYAWGQPGVYDVTLGPVFSGCGVPTIKHVAVYSSPNVYLGADTSICPGSTVIPLTAAGSIVFTNTQWLWNTGETTPNIFVTEPGTYFVTVTGDGCTAADTINIANDCYINVPNVFTPNADGVNDYFFPRSVLARGLLKFSMSIYNRWGEEIFKTTSTDGMGWDGKFNDIPQPAGVFVYVIDASFVDGQKYHKQGNVTLLR